MLMLQATEARERWGCPRGHASGALDPDLAAEARYVARLTDTPEATTCPLACITFADPWVREVTEAVSLATDWHVPIETTLGRDLTRADVQALTALKQAQHDAWTSDRKIQEAEQESQTQARKRGGGARS